MRGDGHAGLEEAYIRVLLTRGVGELSYNPAACPTPTLVIIVKPFPAPPEWTFSKGIRVSLVSVRRNHPQALNPMIKSNNLLNNALAMQEALKRHGDEALMCNQAGELVECSQSNFFLVRDNSVLTPPLSAKAARRPLEARPKTRVIAKQTPKRGSGKSSAVVKRGKRASA